MARILVIDDEPVIVMVLKEILSDVGHEIFTAFNGVKGLELLEEGIKPDLLIIDLLMPGMGGRDFLKAFHSNPERRNVPVILITGSIPTNKDFPMEGSYQEIICKPFDINEVIEKVNLLLQTNYS